MISEVYLPCPLNLRSVRIVTGLYRAERGYSREPWLTWLPFRDLTSLELTLLYSAYLVGRSAISISTSSIL